MKNMNHNTKKWLTVAGCLAICAVLVVMIGGKLQKDTPKDGQLPIQDGKEQGVIVDGEKEDVMVASPDGTKTGSATDNGAVSKGTEQTIQGDPKKPSYTEEELKDQTKKPDGTQVTYQDKVVEHDKVEKPKDTTPKTESKPSGGGNSIPGFDHVPDAGPNQGEVVDGDGDINKQVGTMD